MIQYLLVQGLVTLEGRWSYVVNIRLQRFLVDVYDAQGRHYHLRMAERFALKDEYRNALVIADSFGDFVLRPVGFACSGAVGCIVFEGIDCDAVGGETILRSRSGDSFILQLLDFLALTVESRLAMLACTELDGPGERPRCNGGSEELLERVLEVTDLPGLASHPAVCQHGDFVLNNLVIRDGQLLVLDWEDFGKVSTPGFDLAILLCSALDFDPVRVKALAGIGSGQARSDGIAWLDDALRTLKLERGTFLAALPIYLFRFLELKKGYSPAIRQKVFRAMEGLL